MLASLEIFFGDANNALARVYARLPAERLPEGCRLTGRVVGPTCAYSRTLPASIQLAARPSPAGEALLAEAIVPDPCFWTSDLPFLYQVQVELRRGDNVLESIVRPVGIRPLAITRRRFIWEGRAWVPRSALSAALPTASLADWRAADLVMCVERPADELCAEASRLGAVVAAELSGSAADAASEARRLARWPAVAMLLLDASTPIDAALRQAARNLLLGRVQSPGNADADHADFIVCEGRTPDTIAACALVVKSHCPPAVLARLDSGWHDSLSDARRACDALQAELAGRGEFAGYLV